VGANAAVSRAPDLELVLFGILGQQHRARRPLRSPPKSAREQRPITVMINVTAADANSFRASQGQIAAEMARAVDRASRDR
jgi:hypothetical protein